MRSNDWWRGIGLVVAMVAACGGDRAGSTGEGGSIEIDGSSTVFLISEAVAEEFSIARGSEVGVTVAFSGTGGGFKRFCAGEIDIADASREIKSTEAEECAANGVEYDRYEVALDGIAVVANPANEFAQCLTVDELRSIWSPPSTVRTWAEVRPEWPAQPLKLYGADTNSGTFDYFTEAVVGEEGASRSDYTASSDDNVLVQGVEGDAQALGYLPFAYYEENQGRLKLLAVDGGSGCVTPSAPSIRTGEYAPLSRPLFIYVSRSAMQRPVVGDFLRFYLEQAPELSREVGYVPLEPGRYTEQLSGLGSAGSGD